MAQIEDNNIDMDSGDIKDKAKDVVSEHQRGFGIGAGIASAAAIFTTGFLIGHKRAESQSSYQKLMRHISNLK